MRPPSARQTLRRGAERRRGEAHGFCGSAIANAIVNAIVNVHSEHIDREHDSEHVLPSIVLHSE